MAFWNSLGQVATVAQLTGVDASGLISMILEAVRTVNRNREECRHLARRVMMISDLVQKLQGWDMMQVPEIRRPLDGLDDTLREAYVLIVSCQNCSIAYRFLMGWKQAERFQDVQKKIDTYIQLYPFISHIDITRRLDKLCNSANPSCSQIQGACRNNIGAFVSLSNTEARTQDDGSGFEHTELQTNTKAAQPYLREENKQSGYWEHNDMRSVRNNKFMWCCWWLQDIKGSPYSPRFIDHQGRGLPVFCLSELKAATNNFSSENVIGCGAFGTVYKGELNGGLMVAIKRCFSSGSCADRKELSLEFESEIKVLLRLHHKNIVNLLGYCIKQGERMLVYEYIPNGDLTKFIFGTADGTGKQLWPLRFNIIKGIAQGIVYLHEYCDVTILHRDLKPSNVLLDSAMNPKIIDFGLARILGGTMNEDAITGTIGYMDPEYAMLGRYSSKSDVYSFGVILFEVISAKRCSTYHKDPLDARLFDYAWERWTAGRSLELVDLCLHGELRFSEIRRCIQIALLCVEPRQEDRPTMRDVILMLSSDSVRIPSPKRRGYEDPQAAPPRSTEQTQDDDVTDLHEP